MVDVVVVGARCAGASTAMLLSRAGYRVLMLDRARFPSDTLSTHYIHQPGLARLDKWGLLEEIAESGCPAIDRGVNVIEGEKVTGWAPEFSGIRATYAPRRHVLDTITAQAAVRSGVDFRDGCSVDDLVIADGRVTGVSYRTPAGTRTKVHARLVVGADGMRSTVARLVNAAIYVEHPRESCVYYTYWPEASDALELYNGAHRGVSAVPTHQNQTVVAAYLPQSEFPRIRTDPMTAYLAAIRAAAPELAERLVGRQPTERLRGTGDQQNFFRTATGPGWVLVGDAGHHLDSVTAQGITNAYLQAELLADRLKASNHDLDEGLREFAAARDDMLYPSFHATLHIAQLNSAPVDPAFVRKLQQAPGLADQFFGLIAGTIDLDFLSDGDLEVLR